MYTLGNNYSYTKSNYININKFSKIIQSVFVYVINGECEFIMFALRDMM